MPSLGTRLAYEKIQRQELRLTDAIDGSWTEPSAVLTATVINSTRINIDMEAHTRRYPDGTTVLVSSASAVSTAFAADYAVSYDDATRATTAPTIAATTAVAQAANNYVRGRHFVGNLTTPATTAAAPTEGGTFPPGGGGSYAIP